MGTVGRGGGGGSSWLPTLAGAAVAVGEQWISDGVQRRDNDGGGCCFASPGTAIIFTVYTHTTTNY